MCVVNFFESYGHIISTTALLITLGVLIWYAWETRGLRKEAVRQTELSQRPYVILIHTGSGLLSFENIGLSHALDVSVDVQHMDVFLVRLQPCHLVRKGQKVKAGFLLEGKDAEADEIIRGFGSGNIGFPFFETHENIKDYPLTVHYENIEGTRYYTQLEVRVKERRVVVLKSEKSKV
ncbi:hypothetical protein LCGC14_0941190 [marine sediment metagenome]|uniref:Uncharacterized protein n=1 Tax=marine sediment metagenome TaxID=412755 RepID=A0A0F9NPM8_9ZZZZ|nr:hypothetical protein [Candidatus Aminicenantes bacterium]